MQTLTKEIISIGLNNRILTDEQLSRLVKGSEQRRYNLVNRAMKSDELIRLKRGVYILSDSYRDYPLHPFALAQMLMPGSYVSLETALAHHRWIPEAVYTVASILPGRKSQKYDHEKLGSYAFFPLATNEGYFLELVKREQHEQQTMLVAKPVRALMDLVCLRKQEWQGIDWLTEGLRIDIEKLRTITGAELRTLALVYKHKRMQAFASELARELGND